MRMLSDATAGEAANPEPAFVLPLLVGIIALAVVAAFVIVALAQIARATRLDEGARALWVLIVIAAPVLGALAWFWIGSQQRSPTSDHG